MNVRRHDADAAPTAWLRRSDGNYRAVTIPWTKARATSAPAGLLAHGSQLDARLPGYARARLPVTAPENRGLCIALSAYSCRDSRGFGAKPRTTFPIKLPCGSTGAIIWKRNSSLSAPSIYGKAAGMPSGIRIAHHEAPSPPCLLAYSTGQAGQFRRYYRPADHRRCPDGIVTANISLGTNLGVAGRLSRCRKAAIFWLLPPAPSNAARRRIA